MAVARAEMPAIPRPLRLWPGVAAVVVQLLAWFVAPLLFPEAGMIAFFGALACTLIVLLWWLFFSRAPWLDRFVALGVIVLGAIVGRQFIHESIAGGAMGMMYPIFSLPLWSLALVAWAVASRHLARGTRYAALVATVAVACILVQLVRTEGMSGEGSPALRWRWTKTSEERLLEAARSEPALPAPPPPPAAPPSRQEEPATSAAAPSVPEVQPEPAAVADEEPATQPEWPGFRGPLRDGIVRGVSIDTDWAGNPPNEMWRRAIGPGWSSFAVDGDVFYTQEQRGEEETVSCHRLDTGEPVWRHADAVRFWESNAGAGPRGTPMLADGHVYTLGATGVLNALDARTGAPIWSRNAATDLEKKVPGWGIASSPLVVEDLVVVAASGRLGAYDRRTGEPRWSGPAGGWGYSSPHFATLDGVPQVLLLDGSGVIAVAPADGAVLWQHEWKGDGIVQPGFTADGDVLVGSGSGFGDGAEIGLRRLHVAAGSGTWSVEPRFTSVGIKPYFNDYVVHDGHAYGFDGSLLACVELAGGERKWKGGRYGHGQLIALADQGVLVVLSEQGEIALVRASPDGYSELGKIDAIQGKTWNHPVLVDDVLLVRNDEEMAAFRLARPRP